MNKVLALSFSGLVAAVAAQHVMATTAQTASTNSAILVQRQDTVVRVAGNPVHPGLATLREDLSIGRTDGPNEYLLVSLRDVHLGWDGSIFIADAGTANGRMGALSSIRRYDSTGKYVRSYGRGGQGPGEFQAFSGMHLLRDGRFLQYDGGGGRINVYAANGTNTATWKVSETAIGGQSNVFYVNPNGRLYVLQTPMSANPTAPRTRFAIELSATGTVVDSIHLHAAPTLPDNFVTGTSSNGSPRRATVPFSATWRNWFSPLGYFVTARTDRYAIDLNPPGGPVTSIRRNVEPVPVASEERSAFRAGIETTMRRTQPAWTWNGPDIPRVKPHFLEIMTDVEGRIWARVIDARERFTPETDLDDGSINYWDVFEPAGRYLGRVQTPIGVHPQMSRGDHMLGLAENADGVQRIVRYRIQWSAERSGMFR